MNKNESKYFNTAIRMDEALITLLEKKDFEYITIKEICDTAGVNRSTFALRHSLSFLGLPFLKAQQNKTLLLLQAYPSR